MTIRWMETNCVQLPLSNRELEILHLIIWEHTTEEIAHQLCLSSETIKTHRKNLLEKLRARNVAGLVRRAFEYNLIMNHPTT